MYVSSFCEETKRAQLNKSSKIVSERTHGCSFNGETNPVVIRSIYANRQHRYNNKIGSTSQDYSYSINEYFSKFQKTENLTLGLADLSGATAFRKTPDKPDMVAMG